MRRGEEENEEEEEEEERARFFHRFWRLSIFGYFSRESACAGVVGARGLSNI